ncbi:conserved exported hypothetical protein [Flavobacterium sp. 9AF]|uniref:gliding motility-associated C-terminal domain-containing protein n=1 Tax=Flavobacterium sp. 9AF TaxID=2653142 RepID=UPI0012EF5DF7|nr:gliding motility-associated C-terminal domain-containing protein [Flavobacterium sp. 9AF]VXC16649.1 conserved exported hypothetical protein [Flavobacterium sp. 9AF]
MRKNRLMLIILISFIFFKIDSFAQCAGNDNSITICDKENYNQGLGNSNGVVDLFTLLGIGATPGGTWTNINSSGGFNSTTGILNTWQINISGTYNYQYTINGIPGCTDNSSTITIILGGYPGVNNPSAVACDNNTSVPLFSFLGSSPNPHFNGTWSGGPAGALTGNFFNAQLAGIGTYTLTYSVPAIGSCPSRSVNVDLTVHPLPEAGTPLNLTFCENDNFSSLTNVDLFSLLTGEDTGGSWIDNSSTGELSGSNDSFINIQNIANNFGAGTYTFTYSVSPTHPICSPASSNVAIIIEPVIDINGSTLTVTPNVCFSDISSTTFIGTINQGANPIPNGTYNITYTLTGSNSGTETVSTTFNAGSGSFIINPNFVANIGVTTVSITNIVNPNSTTNCTQPINNLSSTFEIFENPNISDTQLQMTNACLGQDGQGFLVDVNNNQIELINGNYTITYDITGPNGTTNGQTTSVVITNGNGVFTILNTLLPTAGNYSLTITNFENQTTGCNTPSAITNPFEVFPIPDAQSINIAINDVCIGNQIVVSVSGAINLPDGFYNLNYDITGAISVSNQAENNVQFINGNATFTIPFGIINLGTSTLTLTNLINITNTCNTTTFNNPNDTFIVSENPNVNNTSISIIEPICIGSDALGTITAPSITNGSYTVYYTISGSNSYTGNTIVSFFGGNGSITIPNSQIPVSGTYTIQITSIENPITLCSSPVLNTQDIFVVSNSPNLTINDVTVAPICLGNNAIVEINTQGGLTDGNYDINYSLSGANGPLNTTVTVFILNGSGNFVINSANLTQSGLTSVSINSITNNTTNCGTNFTSFQIDFMVNELPDFSGVNITVNDICVNQDAFGTILNASNLENSNYSITFNLTGSNTSNNESFTTTIDLGAGSFIIPGNLLQNAGNTSITLTSITNLNTGCTTNGLAITTNFEVIPLPDTTGANIIATDICVSEIETIFIQNANGLSDGSYTLNYELSGANQSQNNSIDVTITNGNGSFDIPSNLLINGGNTTITIQNIIYNASLCGSNTLTITPTNFTINNPSQPTLLNEGNLFCAQDNPTIANLTANTNVNGTITWYDAPNGGVSYLDSDVLVNGTTYYASTTDASGCEGSIRLEVIVDLTNCSDLFIPDGFSPNNDGLNDTFYIKNLDILYPNFELEIYNRYGNLVYKGNMNTPHFDGKPNQSTVLGKDILPTGVYFYILHYNDNTDKKPTQGRLYLSR